VNPHATQIVSQQVVKRVPREERQAVGDPVLLVRIVVEVGLCPLPQLSDGLSALLVSAGPDAEADAVKGMRRILLKDE
jgi:hypothetical protein